MRWRRGLQVTMLKQCGARTISSMLGRALFWMGMLNAVEETRKKHLEVYQQTAKMHPAGHTTARQNASTCTLPACFDSMGLPGYGPRVPYCKPFKAIPQRRWTRQKRRSHDRHECNGIPHQRPVHRGCHVDRRTCCSAYSPSSQELIACL